MPKMEERYKKLVERRLMTKDKVERNKIFQETRAMEREGARAGKILEATIQPGGKVAVAVKHTSSKQSLHEEYCRRFDGDTKVILKEGDKPTTLREYHERRLLGR